MLSDLRPTSQEEVRFSTAVSLTHLDLKSFKQIVFGVTHGLPPPKKALMVDGVTNSNKLGRLLDRDGFNIVFENIRLTKIDQNLYNELKVKPLDMWLDLFNSQKTKTEIIDE